MAPETILRSYSLYLKPGSFHFLEHRFASPMIIFCLSSFEATSICFVRIFIAASWDSSDSMILKKWIIRCSSFNVTIQSHNIYQITAAIYDWIHFLFQRNRIKTLFIFQGNVSSRLGSLISLTLYLQEQVDRVPYFYQ